MNTIDKTIYKILLWACPFLLAGLLWVGSMGVGSVMSMRKDLQDIKVTLAKLEIYKEMAQQYRVDFDRRLSSIESKLDKK